MITVKELIKENDIEKHIVNNYVPYAIKTGECRQIVEQTSYKIIDDKKIYWKDTPNQFVLFNLRLIANYTDIDLGDNILESFDELNKNDILFTIIKNIPQREYNEWKTILESCNDDLYKNIRDLPAYLDTKLESIKLMFNTLEETINNLKLNQIDN